MSLDTLANLPPTTAKFVCTTPATDTTITCTTHAAESLTTPYVESVSPELREAFLLVNIVIISGPLSFFGIVGNIVNMMVFIKQGFKDSINISLLGLAVSDLACMLTVFWMSISYNPLVVNAENVPFEPHDTGYLMGGWPHECFNRATSFITAFITLERCLCITTPLKVKTIITPRRTKIIITGIFVIMLVCFSPTYFVNSMRWKFSEKRNRTVLSLHQSDNRLIVDTISFLIHSVFMSGISLFAVIICTVILIVKLNEKARWRKSATGRGNSESKQEMTKEKKVVKMITAISTIFLICFVPANFIFFLMVYEPDFTFYGRYHNLFTAVWASAFMLESINSSVNIFIYYYMSSKYKATLVEIFCRRKLVKEKPNPSIT